jgi:hypothetical protein
MSGTGSPKAAVSCVSARGSILQITVHCVPAENNCGCQIRHNCVLPFTPFVFFVSLSSFLFSALYFYYINGKLQNEESSLINLLIKELSVTGQKLLAFMETESS